MNNLPALVCRQGCLRVARFGNWADWTSSMTTRRGAAKFTLLAGRRWWSSSHSLDSTPWPPALTSRRLGRSASGWRPKSSPASAKPAEPTKTLPHRYYKFTWRPALPLRWGQGSLNSCPFFTATDMAFRRQEWPGIDSLTPVHSRGRIAQISWIWAISNVGKH